MARQKSRKVAAQREADYRSHEARVAAALKAIDENPTSKLKHIAKAFGISRQTLYNRYYGRTTERRKAHPEQMNLQPHEEAKISEWVRKWEALGYPPKPKQLRRMVVTVLKQERGGNQEKMGKHWTMRFLKRNPEIATRLARAMDRKRYYSATAESVNEYFDELEDLIRRRSIEKNDIWNFDEKGFSVGKGEQRSIVIASSAPKTVYHAQSGRGEWVTAIECASAAGKKLPGYFIYAGSSHMMGWHSQLNRLDPNIRYNTSATGWTNDILSYDWLVNHFERWALPSRPGAVRLLLTDNHNSHETFEFMDFCEKHQIALFFFQSHTTHFCQPLDVGVFSTLGGRVREKQDDFIASHPPFTPILKGDFIPICEDSRQEKIVPEIIISAFEATGISPPNRKRILDNPDLAFLHRARILNARESSLRSHTSEIQRLASYQQALSKITNEELRKKFIELLQAAQQSETERVLAQEDLRVARAAQKPAKTDRRQITKARSITGADLLNARHIKLQEADKTAKKRKRKGKKTAPKKDEPKNKPEDEPAVSSSSESTPGPQPPSKRTRSSKRGAKDDEDVIYADDSEVERQVDVTVPVSPEL
jgi:hypothetical protein